LEEGLVRHDRQPQKSGWPPVPHHKFTGRGRRRDPPGIGPRGLRVSAPAANRPHPLAPVVVGPLLEPEGGPRRNRPGIDSLTWADGLWGYVDLNHGPLPYQGSALTG